MLTTVLKNSINFNQIYFEWAANVVSGLAGTNQLLEDKLAEEFAKRGVQIQKKN
jgi:hypothetical protein